MPDFLKLAQDAYEASTTYVDANYRPEWDYALRAFRNEHAAGSKYLSEEYKSRSRIFPPHTRTIIRKNEAAAAMALFSNMEIVNITPGDPDNMMSVAGAEAMKAVLEYRLTKSIPAFLVCIGGFQDAQTTGTVVSYNYWEYQVKNGKKIKDKPCVDLRPIENIRIDAGASWLDPVNTSPYFCDIIPMYVCDVKGMMESETSGWKKHEDSVILRARPDIMDSTRKSRLGNKQDPHDEQKSLSDFDVVWVMRWFMKNSQSDDYTYYTLGTEELLTEAKPLEEEYFHGIRPYVIGCCILEAHKTLKTGIPNLIRPLQAESTDVTNQRLDNVKFVLNKRWLVARGRQVDVQSLVRNVPGGVTMLTDPKTDVQESNWPDVTSSAFVEHDRIKASLDDLAGNFSPSTKVANNAVNDTLGGSQMANQSAGIMTDYLIRTLLETWWEPTLRQLVQLEKEYETDEVVLMTCGRKAGLFPRYVANKEGVQRMLESHDGDLVVNVGMGSSDPRARLQKFIFAIKLVIEIVNTAPPGVNVKEVAKEIFSMAGYRDGARFISEQQDPRLLKALDALKRMQAMLEGKQMELQANAGMEQAKLQSNERIQAAKLQTDQARIQGDLQLRAEELRIEAAKLTDNSAQMQAGVDMQRQMLDSAFERWKAELEARDGRWKALLDARTTVEVAEIQADASLEAAQVNAANQATE